MLIGIPLGNWVQGGWGWAEANSQTRPRAAEGRPHIDNNNQPPYGSEILRFKGRACCGLELGKGVLCCLALPHEIDNIDALLAVGFLYEQVKTDNKHIVAMCIPVVVHNAASAKALKNDDAERGLRGPLRMETRNTSDFQRDSDY